jgi:hypothetical protein
VSWIKPKKVRVTRDVDIDEPHNYSHRDVWAGEIFYTCMLPTYNCVDIIGGIALTERPDQYPFFEFPKDAVEYIDDISSVDQPEVPA